MLARTLLCFKHRKYFTTTLNVFKYADKKEHRKAGRRARRQEGRKAGSQEVRKAGRKGEREKEGRERRKIYPEVPETMKDLIKFRVLTTQLPWRGVGGVLWD